MEEFYKTYRETINFETEEGERYQLKLVMCLI